MPDRNESSWSDSKGLARAILHDRAERRKWLGRMVLVPLGMLAIGLWVIDAWLWQTAWRALLWWGGCALATFVVMIFAMYDAVAVVREERSKPKRDVDSR